MIVELMSIAVEKVIIVELAHLNVLTQIRQLSHQYASLVLAISALLKLVLQLGQEVLRMIVECLGAMAVK
jgi:hypothetical protein